VIVAGEYRLPVVVAAVLLMAVAAELAYFAVGGGGPSLPGLEVAPPQKAGPSHSESTVQMILARPLFQSGRRSAGGDVVSHGIDNLPRLTGVMFARDRKVAVFQPVGGKPQVLKEGNAVGGWIIRTIGPHQVVLEKNGGTMTIEPVKDTAITGVANGLAPQAVPFPGQNPAPPIMPTGRMPHP
jgi:hypothetical protein